MANVALNADFRFSDAAERQVLRQVAAQQENYQPIIAAAAFVVRQVRGLASLFAETNAAIQQVEQRYLSIRRHYL